MPLVMLHWAYAKVKNLMPRRSIPSTDAFAASMKLKEIENKIQKYTKDGEPHGLVFTATEIFTARTLQQIRADMQFQ